MCVPRHPPVSRQAPGPDKVERPQKVRANSMSLVPEYGPRADHAGHRDPRPRSLRPFFERIEPRWLIRPPVARRQGSSATNESEPVSCLRCSRCCSAACPHLCGDLRLRRSGPHSVSCCRAVRSIIFCGLPQGKKASHPSYSVTSKFCLSPHRRIDAISTDRRAAHLQPRRRWGGE